MSLPEEYSSLQVQKENAKCWYFLCPFHGDHKPSLEVNKSGQYAGWFTCWPCDIHGSPRRFAELMGMKPSQCHLPKRRAYKKSRSRNVGPKPDFAKLSNKYERKFLPANHEELEKILRIEISIKSALGFRLGWCQEQMVYTAPVYDANWKVTGILRRFPNGKKFMQGSVKGLFLNNHGYDPNVQVLLNEGLSDCLAGCSLDFQVIGGPDAQSCIDLLCTFVMKYGLKKPIVFRDNDSPGIDGANQLADRLSDKGLLVKVIELPDQYKDFRELVIDGATREDVQRLIDDTPAIIPMKIQRFRMSK